MYLLASHLMVDDWLDIHRLQVTYWTSADQVVPGSCEPDTFLCDRTISNELPSLLDRMQYLDFVTYLPDDILTKVDRATMAVGLEARVPLLDESVVEFAWGLQRRLKVQNGRTKWLLRRVLHKYVPAELVDRPKRGFSIPLGSWLRAELREWSEDLLSHSRLVETGLLDPAQIRLRWNEHVNGPRNLQDLLWPVLMFQAWQAEWRTVSPAEERGIDAVIVN